MENYEKKSSRNDSNDIDLGSVLLILGRGFRSIGRFFYRLFVAFGDAILHTLLFLKRRMWWLIGALVIGLSLGSYLNHLNGTLYYSVMTARYNFGSTRALYSTVDYLNAMIGEHRQADLSKLLSISPAEARTIKRFSVEPLKSEKIISDLYDEYFLSSDRSFGSRTDTFWTRTIKYSEFKEGLTKYDIPIQQLTAYSIQPDIFPKIEQGLINAVVRNGTLKRNEEINKRILGDEEQILVSSIQGLDTLRQVYNERLRRAEKDAQTGTTNLTVLDRSMLKPSPELELYDKLLQFKDELKAIRAITLNNQEIVQVSASFVPLGRKVSILKQSIFNTALQLVTLTLLILVIIEIYKALGSYEKSKKVIS
jgi:hypothetical protein